MNPAIERILETTDFSDPNVMLTIGAATLGVIVLVHLCLKKPEEEAPKKSVPVKQEEKKGKQQAKGKAPQVKQEAPKVDYSVDHPLWVHSSAMGDTITGFAYNDPNLAAITTQGGKMIIFNPTDDRQQHTSFLKTKATTLSMNDTHIVPYVPSNSNFVYYGIAPAENLKGVGLKVESDYQYEFPSKKDDRFKKEVTSFQLANNSKYIAVSTEDTEVRLWTTSGDLLAKFNTGQMKNKMLRISPDSRFITVGAFTSEVKVWELIYKKTGEFDSVSKVMDLPGITSGMNCVAFSGDSTRIFAAGRDANFRSYRIPPRYALGETPVLEKTFKAGSEPITWMEVSPDGKIVAIIDKEKKIIKFWNIPSGTQILELNLTNTLPNSKSALKFFSWSKDSKYFATVLDPVVYLWKAPALPSK